MNQLNLSRLMVLAGVSGLIGLMSTWFFAFAGDMPQSISIIAWCVMVLPLLIALPGLFRQKIYTHQWVTLLTLMYFTHGIMEIWGTEHAFILALLETALSINLFVGCILWLKVARRQNA